jgi:hypothetical protein
MRIFAVMIGFNNPEMIREAFNNFESTVDPQHQIIKWFFDPGFPLPDREQNKSLNKKLCSTFGWAYTPIENHGVIRNWNAIVHDHLNMVPGDFLITFDADVRMSRKGWIPAMIEALESDPAAMFCCSAMRFHDDDWMQKRPYNRKVTTLPSGLRVSRYDCLIAWPSGMWRADALVTRPRHFAEETLGMYGYNEHRDYDRLLANGWTWLSVTDYYDDHKSAIDPKYVEWKQLTANGSVGIRFEEWLNER